MSPEELYKPLLTERGKVHGDWSFNASVQRCLKDQIRVGLKQRSEAGLWPLTIPQLEALDMICVKISRIIAGDPSHADHWDDIAGYAQLGKGK